MNLRVGMLAVSMLALGGCRGREITRVSLGSPGQSGVTSWKADPNKPVRVWADYRGSWRGPKDDPGLEFLVDVRDGGRIVSTRECATGSCKSLVCGSVTSVGGDTEGDCECLLDCKLEAPEAKEYTLTVRVDAKRGGQFDRASLVLRE